MMTSMAEWLHKVEASISALKTDRWKMAATAHECVRSVLCPTPGMRQMARPALLGLPVFYVRIRDGRTCVYVHHVDKDAFLKGNIDPDPDELDMVFDLCPSYGELLEQVRKDSNWMDPSDVVEFDAIPAPINEEANIEPLSCVDEANEEANIEHEPLLEANDEHDDDENDGNVLHDNNLGDLDKYNLQETMDHSIPYSRGYASESDDEGPDEEVDEEGFTAKEAEAFRKVLKRDHRTPLFEDLSLADEAVIDGGEGILFGVRPPSHQDRHGKNIILPGSKFETFFELKMWYGRFSTQQGKSGVGEEKDATSEEQRLMERAAKKLREEDAAEARKKKDEEYKARMDESGKWNLSTGDMRLG
ncbi:hypothetical protein D1007_26467 [Hordeum vulgare]|nr:hypothetical protein D1007_26467 [Hordeum vulgare]